MTDTLSHEVSLAKTLHVPELSLQLRQRLLIEVVLLELVVEADLVALLRGRTLVYGAFLEPRVRGVCILLRVSNFSLVTARPRAAPFGAANDSAMAAIRVRSGSSCCLGREFFQQAETDDAPPA